MTRVAQAMSGMAPDAFRALMRHQANTVTVITADGTPPVGFTATSLSSVSLRPALVSFCVDTSSSSRSALAAVRHVGVHILRADQEEVARAFAARGINRFARHRAWRIGPHGVPLLDGVAAWAVCEVRERVTAGDHEIVVAAPLAAGQNGEAAAPLVHYMGAYTALR